MWSKHQPEPLGCPLQLSVCPQLRAGANSTDRGLNKATLLIANPTGPMGRQLGSDALLGEIGILRISKTNLYSYPSSQYILYDLAYTENNDMVINYYLVTLF